MVSCSQLPPNSVKHRDIPDSSSHRYPTHMMSHNHCHRMCICEDMGRQKPLNFTFIHTDSTFPWFHTLNLRQTRHFTDFMAMIHISRTQVHTGTPHIMNRLSKMSKNLGYTHRLYITLCLCFLLLTNSDNHRNICRSSSTWGRLVSLTSVTLAIL